MSQNPGRWQVVVDADGRTRQVPAGARFSTAVSRDNGGGPAAPAPGSRLPVGCPDGFRLALTAANQRARAAREEIGFLRQQIAFLNGQVEASRQAEREIRMLFAAAARPALEAGIAPGPTSAPAAISAAAWALLVPLLAAAGTVAWLAFHGWRW